MHKHTHGKNGIPELTAYRDPVVPSSAVPKGVFVWSKKNRNKMILSHIRSGKTNPQIALAMRLAPETVNSYVKDLLEDLGATTRTQAVMVAMSRGLIPRPPVRGDA